MTHQSPSLPPPRPSNPSKRYPTPFLSGPAAIRHELNRVAAPLLASGRYVPLADGRIRAAMSFKNYRTYRSLLHELVS